MKTGLRFLFILIPIVLITVLVLFSVLLNKKEKEIVLEKVEYTTKDNRTSFMFYENYKKENIGEYDLYVVKNNKQVAGFFTYNLNEYEENSSKEILDNQINYFLNTRNDMKLFKKETIIELEDKKITKVEYSGSSSDSSECIYIFAVIDFYADTNYVVYTNEVILKSDYEKNIGEMNDILKSAKLN